MNDEMRGRITRYEELGTRLNAVNGLITDLMAEREGIKAEQRVLANGMVSRAVEELTAGSTARTRRPAPGQLCGKCGLACGGACTRDEEMEAKARDRGE
jgi:hypothetical protein